MSITYIHRTGTELFQGDILENTVYYSLPSSFLIIREGKDGILEANRVEDLPDAFQRQEIITAHGEKLRVIVLSDSCDAQHKVVIQVAPVFPISKLPSDQRPLCRTNMRMHNLFYLPEDPKTGLEESYISFNLMISYPVRLLNSSNRMTSISDESINKLHEHLLFYFTRKILKEISPPLPIDEA